MKNFIFAFILLLPTLVQSQDKALADPYSIMDWVTENAPGFQALPPNAIDVNLCNLINPVFEQNSLDLDGVFNDLNCGVCNAPQINADNFIFASNQSIGSICWVGYFFEGTAGVPPGDCTPMSIPTFTIDYYQDMLGLPGALIASYPVTPTVTPTGNIIGGANQTIFSTEHAPVDFDAGVEYWVAIYTSIPDVNSNCDYAWDISGDGDGFSSVANNFPIGWVGSATDYTFFLGSTTPIPTLSQWSLMILGLLFVIIGAVTIKFPVRKTALA